MAATLRLVDANPSVGMSRTARYRVGVTFSADYPAGGEPIDFTELPLIKASADRLPVNVQVPGTFAGYLLEWIKGTDMTDGAIYVWAPTSAGAGPGTQFTPGAYAAALKASEFIIEVEVLKNC